MLYLLIIFLYMKIVLLNTFYWHLYFHDLNSFYSRIPNTLFSGSTLIYLLKGKLGQNSKPCIPAYKNDKIYQV